MAKRWQPPPMGPQKSDERERQVRVDEQVVRNVLRVNPELRDGRTTVQVKKALERGEAAKTTSASSHPGGKSGSAAPTSGDEARQLGETLDFFMSSKQRDLSNQLAELDERRRMLDQEERDLREDTRRKLINFVAMLDAGVVAIHGKNALAPHRELLAKLGLTATELLDAVKRGGR